MREQVSLSYAKQCYKRNILRYGESASFENAILTYYLNKEEITNLYKYALKVTKSFTCYAEERMLTNKYNEYLKK